MKKIEMKTLFENKKSISKKDLRKQFGNAFIASFVILSLILFSNHIRSKSSSVFMPLIIAISVFLILIFNALFKKTIHQIDFDEKELKLIITIEKQLKKNEIIEFKNLVVKLEESTFNYRTGKHRVLKISDGEKHVKISTLDKGIGNKNFDEIIQLIQIHYC